MNIAIYKYSNCNLSDDYCNYQNKCLGNRIFVLTNCQNLSIYNNKFPENVDRVSVGFKDCKKVTDIHRTEYKYEFDPKTGKGQGLLTSEILEQCGYFMQEKMYG